jgi:FkbM family methyltransferase
MSNSKIHSKLVQAGGYQFLVNMYDEFIGKAIQAGIVYEEAIIRTVLSILPRTGNIIDVGANLGSHTILFADHVLPGGGKVYSFEPQRLVYQQLCANVALNRLPNVHTYQALLGHTDTLTSLSDVYTDDIYSKGNNLSVDFCAERPQNFGGRSIGKGNEEVQMYQLDRFNFAGVRLLKVDVEGSEPLVFWGAKELIRRERPFIWFERNNKGISAQMNEVLTLPNEVRNFDIVEYCTKQLAYPSVVPIGGPNYLCSPVPISSRPA